MCYYIDSLLKCPLFRETSRDDLKEMMTCFNPMIKEFRRNEIITLEGEKYTGIGVIIEGKASVTKESIAGKRIIMEVIGPGQMFGEMAAFSGSHIWPATVISLESSIVAFLSPDKIAGNCQRQCSAHRKLITNMLGVISNKALMLDKKVAYLAMKNLRGRISTYLLEEQKKNGATRFMLPMNRNEIADYLNVSRPSLSREMCRMRDEGLIDFHRSAVQIKDIAQLVSMAE